MKVLLLAAGYSKRLGELTKDTPKALLPINGKPVLEYIIEKLKDVKEIDGAYLITNEKYYENFVNWNNSNNLNYPVTIKSDGTTSNENRLGAIGDIIFSIENFKINDDLMILATDSYFDASLTDFVNFFKSTNKDVVMGQRIKDRQLLTRLGVAELDQNQKIIGMEEKPAEPKSDIAVYAAYIFKKETLKEFYTYREEGNNLDAPGNFLRWLYKKKDVYTFVFEENFHDIGTVEDYTRLK